MQHLLNCYEITNTNDINWDVNCYSIQKKNGEKMNHLDRNNFKNIIFELKKHKESQCRGWGFIIDVNENTVVVPKNWELASNVDIRGYNIRFNKSYNISDDSNKFKDEILGIIREGFKIHFKNNISNTLGPIWFNFGRYCQTPNLHNKRKFHFCKQFEVLPKMFQNKLVLQTNISTTTVCGLSIAEYYNQGFIKELVEYIKLKQLSNKKDNSNVKVLHVQENGESYSIDSFHDLDVPKEIIGHENLSNNELKQISNRDIACQHFSGKKIFFNSNNIYLVLDTKITQENHRESIIEPSERFNYSANIIEFINGANVFNYNININENPININSYKNIHILPPPIYVRDDNNNIKTIPTPISNDERDIKNRAKDRKRCIFNNGFIQKSFLNPLLACPGKFGVQRTERLLNDLNIHCKNRNLQFQFNSIIYENVEDIKNELNSRGNNALLAVLPEHSKEPQHINDTHEQIKNKIDVPSQCIYYNNTLDKKWIDKRVRDLLSTDQRYARRIRDRYQLCVDNLLVKNGWIPFIPSESFNYNMQIGIDVGGKDNNRIMVCLGYGFSNLNQNERVVFLTEELPVHHGQVEPIQVDYLYNGLLRIFEKFHNELTNIGMNPNFSTIIIYRDGKFLGKNEEWNEKDAIYKLHSEFQNRQWLDSESKWVGVEVQKRAEYLRIFKKENNKISNPTIGHCIVGIENDKNALVCTSGLPYLQQGTASPLKIDMINFFGENKIEDVLKDLVWQADLSFTKPDMSFSLPWVLHVADQGALQLSRNYIINGVLA